MSYNYDVLFDQLNAKESELDNIFYLIEQQYYKEKQKYFEKRSEIQRVKVVISEQKRKEKNGGKHSSDPLLLINNLELFPYLTEEKSDLAVKRKINDVEPKFYEAKNFLKSGIEIEEIPQNTENIRKTMIEYLKCSDSSMNCRYCHSDSHVKDKCPKLLSKKCYVCGEHGHDLYHCKTKNDDLKTESFDDIKSFDKKNIKKIYKKKDQ